MVKRPWTPEQHRAAAELHRQAAKASQNPSERTAHLAAARAHREAGKDATCTWCAAVAAAFTKDAQAETALRMRYARILRESVATPGRRPRRRRRR